MRRPIGRLRQRVPNGKARWGAITLLVLAIAGSGSLLRQADAAAPDPQAEAISDGLQSFSDAASGLANLEELANAVPLTDDLLPTSDDGLGLAHVFGDSLKSKLAAKTFESIAELDSFLDDPDGANGAADDGTYSGVHVDVTGAITQPSTGIYAITLGVTLHRDGTAPITVSVPKVAIDGGSLATDFDLTTSLTFQLNTAVAPPDGFSLMTTPAPVLDVGFDAVANFTGPSAFTTDIGLTKVTVGGPANIGADFTTAVLDPTPDGKITQDDWSSTAPVDLFDVSFGSSHANLGLTLTSQLPGLGAVTGTLNLADTDLANGIDTPTVSLGVLDDFTNMTPQDFLGGIASLASSLNGVQNGGPGNIDLPFLQQSLSELLPVNQKIQDFFVSNHLSHVDTPLTLGPGPASGVPSDIDTPAEYDAVLKGFDTVQEIGAALATTLGVPESVLNFAYDATGHRLSFTIDFSKVVTPVVATIDFAGELERVGVVDVEDALSSVEVSPQYGINFGVSVDLSSLGVGQSPLKLFAFETAGDELTASAPVAADVNVAGKIGFLGLGLKDTNTAAGGRVPIAGPKTAGQPMLKVNIDGGADNLLSIADLLTLLGRPGFTDAAIGSITPTVNVAVPSFDLVATAGASGSTLGTGTLTVAWPDIMSGHPSVSAATDFSDLLAFDFDHANPLALFNQVLDAVEAVANQVDALSGSSSILSSDLPIAGKSFDDIANELRKVSDTVTALTADPSATLQNLEAELEAGLGNALGVPAGAARDGILGIALETNSPTAVVFDLSFGLCSVAGPGCSKVTGPIEVPFNLGLGDGFGGVVGANADGNVELNYAAKTQLKFGVELPTVTASPTFGGLPTVSGTPSPFIVDTSNLSLTANVVANGTFTVSVGPLKLSIGKPDGTDDAVGKVGASFILDNDFGAAGPTRIPVTSADFGTWVSGLPPTDVSPTPKLSCTPAADFPDTYDACARLPVYKNDGTLLGTIKFKLPELESPGGATLEGVTDVLSALVGEGLDWTLIVQGMQQLLTTLTESLDGASFGQSVPIIGDALDAGADIADKFKTHVVDPLSTFATEVEAETEPSAVRNKIQTFFTSAVGSLLVTRPADDVVVIVMCDDGSGPVDCSLPVTDATYAPTDISDVEVAFSLGQSAATGAPIKFDIGMPGLRLGMKDQPGTGDELKATLDWQIDLDFGLNINESFYLRTNNPNPGPGAVAGDPEIRVGATVELPNNPLTGDVAFIPFKATDHDAGGPPADLSLNFKADYKGGGSDSRLSLSELLNGLDPANGPDFAVSLGGGVHLALDIVTGALSTDDSALPTFKTLFKLDWDFGAGENFQNKLGTGDLTIKFEDVRIDLGSMLSGFLKPILDEASKLTKPLKPVIDIITTPIPGVTDLAEVVGCPSLPIPPTFDPLDTCNISLLTLYELQNGSELTMIRRLIQLIEFINTANGSQNANLKLGDFNVVSTAARSGPLSANQKDQLLGAVAGANGDGSIPKPLEKLVGAIQTAVGKSKTTGGFTFPAFDDPSRLFKMLLGQDVTLVHWDAGPLEASVTIPLELGPPIGPIPISVGITIQLGVRGHFAVGYDTKGIRKAVEVLTDDDAGNDGVLDIVDSLFQGIGIDDRLRVEGEPTGEDIPEITLFGSVVAKAAFDIFIAEAGIRGGVKAELRANLHDGGFPHGSEKPENLDGVLRIDEIINTLNNPLCLFDLDGELTAFLEAYIDTFLGGDEFPIVGPVTILNFGDLGAQCKETPKLAHVAPDGTLVLHMGPHSGDRDFKESEENEKMTVRQLNAAGTKFSVSGFGFQEEHPTSTEPAVTKVFADGGSQADTIDLLPGSINTNGTGGDITEQIIPFTRAATICGGGGVDHIGGGDGGDTLVGDGAEAGGFTCSTTEGSGDGNDDISGGGGVDTISGLGGGDKINGDFGGDIITGGSGVDVISGGPGGDRVNGGSEDDLIDGGPGLDPSAVLPPDTNATAFAASKEGGDTLMGGTGRDTIQGGFADDFLYGEDELTGTFAQKCDSDGGAAASDGDHLDGGLGNDSVFGGGGPDDAVGDRGNDKVCGNGGNDPLHGDGGTGTGSPDGNDYVDGGIGDDTVNGGGGNDVVRGRAGADKGDGGAGNDDVVGGAGRDLMRGGDGTDIIVGDDATITGSSESGIAARPAALSALAALVTGVGGGNDATVLDCNAGGTGTDGTSDCLFGGGGNDAIFGEAGHDQLFGDDGDDWMLGGDDTDLMRGGSDKDTMFGQLGTDEMYGDNGADDMQGNEEVDAMRGGLDNDCMQGNGAADNMNGDGGDDRMAGGSAVAGAADEGDTMFGSTGSDMMAGDNAIVCGAFKLLDIPFVGAVVDANASGADTMDGGDQNDTMYGQTEDDTLLVGGNGDDHIEGNAGHEVIEGQADQDDLIGGSGHDEGGTGGSLRKLSNVLDESDDLRGGDGIDYLAGDNTDIRRVAGPSLYDPLGAGRSVELFEVQKVGATPPSDLTYGDDDLAGNDGNDAIFGQGDADRILGGTGGDYAEGNAGADTIRGDAGRDSLVGGGASNTGLISLTSSGNGLLDESDTIYGESDTSDGTALGDGGDAIAGDNARITNLDDGSGLPGLGRLVVLFDTEKHGAAVVSPDTNGPETLYGNSGDDFIFGQGDADTVHGGAGNDYAEGNAGEDLMLGESDEDDLLGGGSAADGVIDANRNGTGLLDEGDRLYGGTGADVMTGDNALIVRTRTPDGASWLLDPITLGHHRGVSLFDTARNAPDDVSGNDLMLGGDQRDRMFGQGGNDTVKGNLHDDFVEGNQGGDLLEGNDGEDDIIGGSRTNGYLDEGDIIHGGAGSDVAIGDNGVIDRVDLSPAGGYYYRTYQIGITSTRFIRLLDIDSADALVAGSDQMSGGADVDSLFGQGMRDYIMGGTEDDYLEGNGGSDFEFGDLNRAQVAASPPPQMVGGLPGLPPGLPLENVGDASPESPEPALSGVPGVHGQDDIIGGSSKTGLLDGGDFQYGNGAADFITGDNATISRTIVGGSYVRYVNDNPTTIVRLVVRFCPVAGKSCDASGRSGGDYQEGNAGDDYLWGQDGADTQFGNADNDDIIGELGDDLMYGGFGEDAMVGDRGKITNTLLADNSKKVSYDTNGPAFFKYTGLIAGQRDRRVNLADDGDGAPFPLMGVDTGGLDRMRGGPGHDSMHGAFGDDLMNGDSGGDWLFGDDGRDALWGGRGCTPGVDPAAECTTDLSRGNNDRFIDYLLGGWGGTQNNEVLAADYLDWLPRGTPATCNEDPNDALDSCLWHAITAPEAAADEPVYYQHFQGVDWMYGGEDRDAMMANVGQNSPDGGDRMIDWKGTYNLYTMCWASYGGDNAIRQQSPALQVLLETLAYGSGAGASLAEVQTDNSPGERELAFVDNGPANNGKPFPSSPGHFDDHPCDSPVPPRDK